MERFLFLALVLIVVALADVVAAAPAALVWPVVAVAVALFGLPHGALDTEVARKAFALSGGRDIVRFVGVYLAAAALVGLFWLVAPLAALTAFLIYAALHFGQDWDETLWRALVVGAAVLTLPAWRFEADVAAIFLALADDGGTLAAVMHEAAPVALFAALLCVWGEWGKMVEVATYAALALTAPPLVAFAVYFTALHSPRHFRETCAWLGLGARRALFAATPYLAAAAVMMGAGAAIFLALGLSVPATLAHVVFVGFACLTVPHMTLELLADRPTLLLSVQRWLGRPLSAKGQPGLTPSAR